MLVLTRKVGEKIFLGDDVIITVTAISGQQVRLGFTAPPEVSILRNELVGRVEAPAAAVEAGAAGESRRQRPLRMFRPGQVQQPV
jgi:carbon storage regulator